MRLALVAAGLAVVLSGCGSGDVPPRYVGADVGEQVTESEELVLTTGCAEDVEASVTETDDEVRISDISGDPIDGDCLGGVRLTLQEPIGDRTLVVNGERWQRLQGSDRPDGRFGPAGVEPASDCRPVP